MFFVSFFVQIAAIINILFALNLKKKPQYFSHNISFCFKWMDYIRKAKIELNGIEWNKYMAPELQIHCVAQQKSLSKTHNYG